MKTTKPQLSGAQQETIQSIFHHPLPNDLPWREVESMLAALADGIDDRDGTFTARRNGCKLVLHRAAGKDLTDVHELMELRSFLACRSDLTSASSFIGPHLLVVIDQREARIYQTQLHGSVPQSITAYDPHGYGRYLHYVQEESTGRPKPERVSFYQAVAHTLAGAGLIMLFGSGAGASSAMHRLRSELKEHHPELDRRVIAEVVVDRRYQTEAQLLAAARAVYLSIPGPPDLPACGD